MINSLELGKKVIKDKIPLISRNPGVYKMISSSGEILYIGKAKNIPNRLKSYVSDTNLPIRTERMLSLTHSLETTTTNNESEALLLEANLIKKHKPRFNILLRDDKSFPYIYIGNKDKWPQLTKLRGKKSKTGHYFGPFSSIGSANWTIKILQKIFLLRVCDDTVFKNRDRPCILYQIKRCSGPCVGHIEEKDYLSTVNDAIDFISGKSRRIQKNLSKEMEKASKELDYEKAAIARDRIKALTQIQNSQKINQTNLKEADVVSVYKETGKTCIQVFFFRSKQNWGNQAFYPKHDADDKIEDILSSLGASKFQVIYKIALPKTLPEFFGALKVSTTLAFIGTNLMEIIEPHGKGLGHLFDSGKISADYPLMFAVLITLALMGIFLYYIVVFLETIFAGWAIRN